MESTIERTMKIMESSKTILTQTKSRCSQDPAVYRCLDEEGTLQGKCNVFRLKIPQILEINRRIQSGESTRQIAEDYPISQASLIETMKKYYSGLFEPAIAQYCRLQK
ncbi:hypothetical protein [Methanobrevibacter boviskoreani]|uniref:hypothetical protein n=1 Tax=Methanobrevibacter boviskoreani TaxID=1348249 RepID=UPI00059379FF|nr:hypothetical protein [Methanobrevibacter boviskoreani]